MKDILRLGHYLKPYKARIALAVLSSFLSSACLGGFLLLVRPIAEETFRPAQGTVAAGHGGGGSAGNGAAVRSGPSDPIGGPDNEGL